MNTHKIGIWGGNPNEETPKENRAKKPSLVDKLFKKKSVVASQVSKNRNEQIEAAAREIIESRSHVKRKHWGLRHAVYAFLFSLLLQTIVTIPLVIMATVETVSSGGPISEADVMSSILSPQNLFLLQLTTYVGWFIIGIYASYRLGVKSLAKDFWFKLGNHRNKFIGWGKDIGLGLLIAAGIRGLEIALFWIFDLLNLDMAGADNGSVFMQGTGFWTYMLLFVVVSFAGPISEEFLFRGMLLQGLLRNFNRRTLVPKTSFGEGINNASPQVFSMFVSFKEFLHKHKYVLAVIISSAAFGIMHFQGVETFGQIWVVIETGLIGAVFAIITLKTKRLGIALAAHCFFNLSGVLLSLLG